VPLAKFTSVVQ